MERVDYESMLVQDLLNSYDREELNVSPWYQRRSVWTTPHKSYLINSIFSLMPVPTIYMRHTLDLEREITVKEVVDGQQRCRSIIDFKANKYSTRHPEHSKRVFYRNLTPSQRHGFLMSKLPVAQLIGADDADVIEIFGRLNAVSKTLNPQEKRAARYSGEFHQFCLKQSVQHLPLWRDRTIFSATEISRMQEVQFIADLTLSMLSEIIDFSAARITKAYKEWDEDFPQKSEMDARLERIFTWMSTLDRDSFRDTIFSRSPVFYSLVIVLDSIKKLPTSAAAEELMVEIDARFNDPRPAKERPVADVEFQAACTATTQRVRQRRVRHEYIRSYFA
ncbi:MAG: DUF262 domain-containing protein [Ornithinimicrobium sp.]